VGLSGCRLGRHIDVWATKQMGAGGSSRNEMCVNASMASTL
jgi:hypothetical protein